MSSVFLWMFDRFLTSTIITRRIGKNWPKNTFNRKQYNDSNNLILFSSSRRSEDGESSVVSSTAATVASGRLSTTAQQPLSENPESEIDSEAAATTTTTSSSRQKSSEKRQQYGSASESGFSEESRVSDDKSSNLNITKRKRNFSNGYNSETGNCSLFCALVKF